MRDAWIHLLLRLHPRRFREEHGVELRELVAEEAEEAARGGFLTLFLFILWTTADLLGSAIRLRVRPSLPGAGGARRSGSRLPALARDALHAFRSLRRTPLVTGVVILTLSLGVGFTTSFFSVADALLLRPLEYRDADRLVEVTSHVMADGSSRALFCCACAPRSRASMRKGWPPSPSLSRVRGTSATRRDGFSSASRSA